MEEQKMKSLTLDEAKAQIEALREQLWSGWPTEDDNVRGHGVDDALAILARVETPSQKTIKPEDVEWVVNDISELGVKIGDQFFWLYKGRSLVHDGEPYEEGECRAGQPMLWTHVNKREFGECVHPINYENPLLNGTVDIEDGREWKPVPAPPKNA